MEAVKRVCSVTRGQLTPEVTDVQSRIFTEVPSLRQQRKRLFWSQELLVDVLRHLEATSEQQTAHQNHKLRETADPELHCPMHTNTVFFFWQIPVKL